MCKNKSMTMTPRPAQSRTISALPGHIPKACCTGDTNMHDLRSTGLCPPGLHRPAQYPLCKHVPLRPAKLGTHTHTITIPLDHAPLPKPVKLGIHRHTRAPIHWPAPFRHTNPMLQTPATSPQLKASTHTPVGPHPPDTCHRKAPNLPKRTHTDRSEC
jgi:hypothetical protein